MQAILLIVFSVLTLVNSSSVNRRDAKLKAENAILESDKAALKAANAHLALICNGAPDTAGVDLRDVNGVPVRGIEEIKK